MKKQVDFKIKMTEDIHNKLTNPTPVDALIDEVEAIMKHAEPDEWKTSAQETKTKLMRRYNDQGVPDIDPIIALHNRLAK